VFATTNKSLKHKGIREESDSFLSIKYRYFIENLRNYLLVSVVTHKTKLARKRIYLFSRYESRLAFICIIFQQLLCLPVSYCFSNMLWIRIRSEKELFGHVGSGISIPDPDVTCLTRLSVNILPIFLQNGSIRLCPHTYRYFLRKSL
jgi:hypothetical protein